MQGLGGPPSHTERVRVLGWAKLEKPGARKVQRLLPARPLGGVHFPKRRKLQIRCCRFYSFWRVWGTSKSSCGTHSYLRCTFRQMTLFWTPSRVCGLIGSTFIFCSPFPVQPVLLSLSQIFLLETCWTCGGGCEGEGQAVLPGEMRPRASPCIHQRSLHVDL